MSALVVRIGQQAEGLQGIQAVEGHELRAGHRCGHAFEGGCRVLCIVPLPPFADTLGRLAKDLLSHLPRSSAGHSALVEGEQFGKAVGKAIAETATAFSVTVAPGASY